MDFGGYFKKKFLKTKILNRLNVHVIMKVVSLENKLIQNVYLIVGSKSAGKVPSLLDLLSTNAPL